MGLFTGFRRTSQFVRRGPDFLVIGAQRAGTSWLRAALSRHPQIWCPPIKELHYFDQPGVRGTWRSRYFRRHLRRRVPAALRGRPRLTSWDLRYFAGRWSDEWYASLFRRAGRRGFVTGEATPAYATLGEAQLRRIHALNPNVRLVYSMRDPVRRTWSAIAKHMRDQGIDALTPVERLRLARSEGVATRSDYRGTIERLERVFDRERIFYCFFDDIASRPDPLLRDVLTFLGVATDGAAGLAATRPTRSATKGRPVPHDLRAALTSEYRPEVRWLCERFGAPPCEWLRRYDALLGDDASVPV